MCKLLKNIIVKFLDPFVSIEFFGISICDNWNHTHRLPIDNSIEVEIWGRRVMIIQHMSKNFSSGA